MFIVRFDYYRTSCVWFLVRTFVIIPFSLNKYFYLSFLRNISTANRRGLRAPTTPTTDKRASVSSSTDIFNELTQILVCKICVERSTASHLSSNCKRRSGNQHLLQIVALHGSCRFTYLYFLKYTVV